MEGLWHRVKTFGPALLAYWVMTFFGLAAFSAVLLIRGGAGGEMFLLLGQLVMVTVVGQLAGHALGFLRPRLFIVLMLASLGCWIQVLLLIPMANGLTVIVWFMAPFTLASGFFAVRSRTEIFGAWVPVMYAVSASLVLINTDAKKLGSWHGGNKFAVWDLFNLAIIAGALLLFLIYLVARQAQSLSLWQDAARMSSVQASANYNPRARISWMTWGVIALLGVALTVGTAAAAPYLFRTADEEEGKEGKGGQGQGQGQGQGEQRGGEGGQGEGDSSENPMDNADMDKVSEGVRQVAQQGANLLMLLIMLLVGLVLIYFVFWRPMRRMAVMRHLERPAWPVPPTQRIQDMWRRALIALHDVGMEPRPTESVKHLAERAHATLSQRFGSAPTGVIEAAEIYSRVEYNIGVSPHDVIRMAASVELLTVYVENNLRWWEQLQNLYGGLKE